MIWPLLLLLTCGGSAPPCASLPDPGARDRCRLASVEATAQQDPEAAAALARAVEAAAERDLALLMVAREGRLDVCEEISGPGASSRCRATIERVHLVPARAPSSLAERDCRGECAVAAAVAAPDLEQAEAACAAIAATTWQSECRFAVADSLGLTDLPTRAAWCARSGDFAQECRLHLVGERAAQVATQAETAEPLLSAAAAAAAELSALDPALADTATTLRDQAVYAHVMADPADRLGAWRALTDPAVLDVVTAAWLRSGGAPPASDLAGLRAAWRAATSPSPPAGPPPPLGKVPESLRALDCPLSDDSRLDLRLVWAASPWSWTDSQALLADGLTHRQPEVRAETLDSFVDRAMVWHQDQPLPPAALALLQQAAHADSEAELRARADTVARALQDRRPPPPWPTSAFRCQAR